MEDFQYIKKFRQSGFTQFSPTGDYILCACGNQIIVIDTKTLDKIHTFKELKYPGKIVFAHNNTNLIACESTIKKLGVFNLHTMSLLKSYKITKSEESQDCNIYFSPDNEKIICGIYNILNNTLSVLDLKTSEIKNLKTFHDGFVNKIEYCNTDNSFIFSIFDRQGHIIEGEIYSKTYLIKWKYPFEANKPIKIQTELALTWKDISYNSKIKQYALYDESKNTLIITDYTLNREIIRYELLDKGCGYFCNLNWSPDGRYIVIIYLNCVKLIRCKDGKCIKDFKVSNGFYSEISPDGKLLLIGTMSNSYLIDITEFLF